LNLLTPKEHERISQDNGVLTRAAPTTIGKSVVRARLRSS